MVEGRSNSSNGDRWRLFAASVPGLALLIVVCLGCVGCSSDSNGNNTGGDQIPCLTELPADDCAPLYTPDYENVFNNTLNKSCTAGGGSCHSESGGKGGLVLVDKDVVYSLLTAPKDGHPLIQTDDLMCSPLLKRLGSKDPALMMPPGNPLDANELCAIVTWVRNGAAR